MEQAARAAGYAGEWGEDAFTRGRYSTDASFYQIMPRAVAVPSSEEDVEIALSVAREAGVPVTARGGGTSQCGQTVNSGLIVDTSRHLTGIVALDVPGRRVVVQPGIVLDALNRALKPHGLWFPVDVSTASRATIGGMAANNSCGGRSLRYGTMRDNVASIRAVLHDGTVATFGPTADGASAGTAGTIARDMRALGAREADLIGARFPKLTRRVGGYNLDALVPGPAPVNLAHLLVGSEGTLAHFTQIELKLSPLVGQRVLGVCHFPTFRAAMEATRHLVALDPLSVELVDATMIGLSRQIPLFRRTMESFVRGEPAAVLLVEFDEGTQDANAERMVTLDARMGELGFSWAGDGDRWGGVVAIGDQRLQAQIAEVRKSGLNIMMSMKTEGKPVSFVEDCAVSLEDLADYTSGLTEVFERHGTRGTWYAHASVGCLHVRPILNLKLGEDVGRMRAIAEEAFALVARYKGSHSGEHGDGIVRSEFHERMFGAEVTALFRVVKDRFDPHRRFNPGKIVDAPRMDDRSLFRFPPDYAVAPLRTAFDWSAWTGAGGGFQGAVEMCNNNGACRKLEGGTMCPSYRVTRDERDATRGRANTLRLAISGQLGPDALTSDAMAETLALCVSCKGCKRECPTGVDMAKMKIEVQAARARIRGLSLRDRLVGHLPAYGPLASRMPWAFNLRNTLPGLARALQGPTGLSAARDLPIWSRHPFHDVELGPAGDVVLLADCFNRWFEPENLRAAHRVLTAGGQTVAAPGGAGRGPLCCGRTYLSVGLVDRARAEAERLMAALMPHVEAGRPIVGLEPSCLLTLRDEIPALLPGAEAARLAGAARMLEEHVAIATREGSLALPLRSPAPRVLLHGHCHQKAMDVVPAIREVLDLLPDTEVAMVETSCCGMAGAFGYGTATEAISRRMGELSLFPAVRAEGPETVVVADGTSCRHQIADGTGRRAIHVARLLESALMPDDRP